MENALKHPSLLLLILGLAGCAASPAPAPSPCAVLGVSDSARDNRLSAVSGSVSAPARMLGLTDGRSEAPPPKGRVYLADAVGSPVPGIAETTIDAEGRYTLVGVPGGHTFFVVATFDDPSGQKASLMTLFKSAPEGAEADLDAASTLLAAALAARLEGFSAPFEAARWKSAIAATRSALKDPSTLDFTSREATLAFMDRLRAANPTLSQTVSALETAWSQGS